VRPVGAGCLDRVLPDIEASPFLFGSGRVAQRYEHCVDIAGVTGSIPVAPTIKYIKKLVKAGYHECCADRIKARVSTMSAGRH
jgi:hypothetical protein